MYGIWRWRTRKLHFGRVISGYGAQFGSVHTSLAVVCFWNYSTMTAQIFVYDLASNLLACWYYSVGYGARSTLKLGTG